MATLSMESMVMRNSNICIVGSNPALRWTAFFCVVLSCVGRGLEMGRYPVERVLPKRLKGFITSEVHSESGEITRTNRETNNYESVGFIFYMHPPKLKVMLSLCLK
jgi:hypothetical protein